MQSNSIVTCILATDVFEKLFFFSNNCKSVSHNSQVYWARSYSNDNPISNNKMNAENIDRIDDIWLWRIQKPLFDDVTLIIRHWIKYYEKLFVIIRPYGGGVCYFQLKRNKQIWRMKYEKKWKRGRKILLFCFCYIIKWQWKIYYFGIIQCESYSYSGSKYTW